MAASRVGCSNWKGCLQKRFCEMRAKSVIQRACCELRHTLLRYNRNSLRRDARVAEGGALLRRYVGLNLHRGFESLSLRQFLLPAACPRDANSRARAPVTLFPPMKQET